MKKEENVYEAENNVGAETARMAQGGEDRSAAKEGLAALRKFKDVNALAKAYEALEAEFTRRSQRLKELEKQAENFSLDDLSKRAGVEKLKRNAEARREQAKAFDAFVATVGSADRMATVEEPDGDLAVSQGGFVEETREVGVDFAQSGAEETLVKDVAVAESTTLEKGDRQEGVAKQGEGASPFVKVSADKPLSSNELYELAAGDEAVRLKIIGAYLQSVTKTVPPLSLGGAGTLAAPPLRAKSIGDAGTMALQYFKKTAE